MKPNKFNKSRNKQGETALGWWKIKKFVFDTSNHPVIVSKEKCAYKVESLLSHQEHQILHGVVNSLQCNHREALRIAIYELDKSGHKAAVAEIRFASKSSKEKGHTARNKKIEIRLPKNEYLRFEDQVEIYELSPKETVRLALLWLAKAIRQTNQDLSNSPRLSQEELARKWSRTYDRKGSKLNALKEASKKAWEEAEREGEARDKALYDKRGEMMAEINEEGSGRVWSRLYGEIPLDVVDAHQQIKEEEWIEKRAREESEKQELNRREIALFRISLEYPLLTKEEHIWIWEDDKRERKEAEEWEEKYANMSNVEREELFPFLQNQEAKEADEDYVDWRVRASQHQEKLDREREYRLRPQDETETFEEHLIRVMGEDRALASLNGQWKEDKDIQFCRGLTGQQMNVYQELIKTKALEDITITDLNLSKEELKDLINESGLDQLQ